MANQWKMVLQATSQVAKWHVHERKKGGGQTPYVNHLIEVATLAAEATGWRDPELVVAALLHDAPEHQGIRPTLIARQFGKNVSLLVGEVTEDKSLPKKERQKRQMQEAAKKSRRAKILKLADQTSNLRAIAGSPRKWRRERRLKYVRDISAIAERLWSVSERLKREFRKTAREAAR